MLNSIFNPQNDFFRMCGKFADVLVLSLMWMVCCLPVVTMGPATTALYYAAAKCVRRGEPNPYLNFFQCLKANFKVSLLASLPLLVLLFLYRYGYAVMYAAVEAGLPNAGILFAMYCVAGLALLGFGGMLFPLISRFPLKAGAALARAGQLALKHLPSAAVVALLLFLSTELIRFSAATLLVLPAVAALLCSLPLERVLRQYVPAEERAAAEELPVEERPWYLR